MRRRLVRSLVHRQVALCRIVFITVTLVFVFIQLLIYVRTKHQEISNVITIPQKGLIPYAEYVLT